MKKLLLLIFLVSFISCNKEYDKRFEFPWLYGSWQRINELPDRRTYEKWLPTMNGNYIGHGYTLQKNDTIFQENLVIKPKNILFKGNDNPWVLQVTGVNESPTIFNITETTENSFTAVNLENEFPTHIRYSIINDTLVALVSNKELKLDFKFIRIK